MGQLARSRGLDCGEKEPPPRGERAEEAEARRCGAIGGRGNGSPRLKERSAREAANGGGERTSMGQVLWFDAPPIRGKNSHVNRNRQKSGIVSHAAPGYSSQMNAKSARSTP